MKGNANEKTTPISNLSKAKTPMLIQHGSGDRRVPLSNAMELYRGLKEMGVPVWKIREGIKSPGVERRAISQSALLHATNDGIARTRGI